MKILCSLLVLFGTLLGNSFPASAAQTFTLVKAVERALEKNPGVEARALLIDQARMGVGVAQSQFWPRVSWVNSRNRLKNSGAIGTTDELSSKSKSHGLRANLSVFAGFAHLSNLQRSMLNVDVEEARYRLSRLELAGNVQMQFFQLLGAREELKSAEESVSRITTQLNAAKSFVKVGMAPYLNVLQNEVELSSAQQRVIRIRNDIRNAEVQLNKYLGFLPDEDVVYEGSLESYTGVVTYTEEEAIKTALFSRPDLVIAQKSIAVAAKDMNVKLGEYLPRVDLSYDDMSSRKDYDDKRYKDYSRSYWNVGLNFSWELFNGGGTTFATLGERKRIQSLRKSYEDTMSSARTEVIRALLDINATKELIATSRKGVEAAKESYAMASKRYMTHTGTITDLLDAQLKLTNAENDASRALAEHHKARSKFFYSIGRENLGLE